MADEQTWEDRIRAACLADGRTIYRLAKDANMDEGQLRRFLSGERGATGGTLERIGRAVGYDLARKAETSPKQSGKKDRKSSRGE